MPKTLLDAIDDFRFAHRVKSRAEAMRRLIEAALDDDDAATPIVPPNVPPKGGRSAAC